MTEAIRRSPYCLFEQLGLAGPRLNLHEIFIPHATEGARSTYRSLAHSMNQSMIERQHLDQELVQVRSDLMEMGRLVERSVSLAIQAIRTPNSEAREQAKVIDQQLDEMEVEIVKRCHQIMGLEAPLASDLRLVISAIRITTALEQIGDLAEGIAKRGAAIAQRPQVEMPPSLPDLGVHAAAMVSQANVPPGTRRRNPIPHRLAALNFGMSHFKVATF